MKHWAEEIAHQLRALATVVEDLGSVPSIHTGMHNHPELHPERSDTILLLPQLPYMCKTLHKHEIY